MIPILLAYVLTYWHGCIGQRDAKEETHQKRFQSLWSWWLFSCPTADAKFVAKKNTPNKFSRSHEFIATPLLVLSGSNCLTAWLPDCHTKILDLKPQNFQCYLHNLSEGMCSSIFISSYSSVQLERSLPDKRTSD